jgi:two-component system sensor histidine kinase/response regulator
MTARNILVVDDEPENIRFLGRLLAGQGYQVHVADSGEQALAALDAITTDERLDLVLLDILMPSGMDGIETCRHLKSREAMRTVPVIFLTGKDDRETMMRAFEAGGADYVLKPFNADVLLARVRTHSELGRLSGDLESALAERTRELRQANVLLRRLATEISLVEERERKRLAGELHDSPMQKLALAQAQVASAAKHRDAESDRMLEVGLELMRDAIQELRTLQFELSPPVLYQEGLSSALRWLASHMKQRFGHDLAFVESGPMPRLDRKTEVILFQCARELVYNLLKHSGAARGELKLGCRGNVVALSVSDNGRGFTPDAARADSPGSGGYGLFGVRERLKLWGGGLDLESDASGARVTVRVPLERALGDEPLFDEAYRHALQDGHDSEEGRE